MKSDLGLKFDVAAELAWDPAVNATRIGVAVDNGVVTLSGEVDSCLDKHAVERAARRVGGVRGIALELQVRLARGHERTDADIAQAAEAALTWRSLVAGDRVKAAVEDGWVTLTGEVDWGYQSVGAEQCIRPLAGVKGVSNQLRLKQRASPRDIRAGIESALTRHRKASPTDHLEVVA